MTIGVSSYTFPWAIGIPGQPVPRSPMSCQDLLDATIELGVSRLQIADNLPVHELSEEERRRLFTSAREGGVEIELGMRGADQKAIERYIVLSRACSAQVLRTVPTIGVAPDDAEGERSIVAELVASARAVLPQLEEAGIVLCFENYEELPVSALREVIDTVASPNVRVCVDTVNSLGRGEGLGLVVDILGPVSGNLHIKDFATRRLDHRLGFLVEGRAAGDGQLPIRSLLASAPRDISVVVELWTPWQGDIDATVDTEREWARRSVEYLRGLPS